jgi:signal transduction histidine kinase
MQRHHDCYEGRRCRIFDNMRADISPETKETVGMKKANRMSQILAPLSIGATIAFLSFLHFQTVDAHPLFHELTQRLYYLPIIYSAWRYGLKGGLGAGLSSVLFFLPHMTEHLHEPEVYHNQTAEMILFLAIGIVTGLLADAQKREHRRYEQAVGQLLLADRLASLGQLSAGLVHEIRNPLASIKGAAEALESEIPLGSRKRAFLDAIASEANRLNTLVTDFLTFARPRTPELLATQPNAVIRSVVSLTSREFQRRQLSLVTHVDAAVPETLMDGEQVKQALLNLVINAIQATPAGGIITLSSSLSSGCVRLTVQDSGPGIPASVKHQLFTPFVTTKEGGTGLGLAIAFSLVKQHGGTINASDAPGGGSVFQIEMPLRSCAKAKRVRAAAAEMAVAS